MKKMVYGSIVCEVSVVTNCRIIGYDCGDYVKDSIIYAVEKFFSKFEKIRRDCTYESWQLRITKRRKRKNRRFWYIIPAVLMELPGNWILVCGDIDPVGVNIRKIEFLKGKEIAFSKGNIRCKKARIGDKI